MYAAAKLHNIFVCMVCISHIVVLLWLVQLGIHQPAADELFNYTNSLINLILFISGYYLITYASTGYLLRKAYLPQQITYAKRLYRAAQKMAANEWFMLLHMIWITVVINIVDVLILRTAYPNSAWSILMMDEFYRTVLTGLLSLIPLQTFYTHRVLTRHQKKRQQRLNTLDKSIIKTLSN